MGNINLENYSSNVEAVEAVKKMLIDNDFTIIQKNKIDTFFTYMKDNKFAYFQFSKMTFDGASISSCYKGGNDTGTGCQYKKGWEFHLGDFEKALNYHFNNLKPLFYKDIQDYLSHDQFRLDSIVTDKKDQYTTLELLDGYYIFLSDRYAPIISKNHTYLFKNYFENSKFYNKHKCIFLIEFGSVSPINHNINLFEDCEVMDKFKSRITHP